MEQVLHTSAHILSQVLDAATLILLALGALLALRNLFVGLYARHSMNDVALNVWQGLSRWMVVGLEFLLISDLVSTVVFPSWDELGRLATIAAIRTALGFFLGRDLEAARRIAREDAEWAARSSERA